MLRMHKFILPLLALSLAACGAPKTIKIEEPQKAETPFSAELASSYLSAKLAARSGDVEKAATAFLGAYAEDPNTPEQLIQAFNFQLAAGHFDTAADLAKRIVQEDLSPSPLIHLTVAVAEINKRDLSAAQDALNKATDAAAPLLQFELAKAYLNLARGIKIE